MSGCAITDITTTTITMSDRFAPQGLGVAWVTLERFFERVSRLYEPGATASRIGDIARPVVEMGQEWS